METISPPRMRFLITLLLAAFGALEWRLFQLQILRHDELEDKAEAYRFATRVEQAWRGKVQDRNGVPLALTLPVKNVYADLAVWTNHVDQLSRVVAPWLGTNPVALAQAVREGLSRRGAQRPGSPPGALLLKRSLTPTEWAATKQRLAGETFGLNTNQLSSRQKALLKRLRRWTLFAEDDQQRYFPHGGSLAPVLGFVSRGTNGHLLQGKWGVEAALNTVLSGRNGVCVSSQDAGGNELAFSRTQRVTARDGGHVILTVDLTLQKVVEEALAKAVARHSPSNATCVVVRPRTGEILALASLPSFNPQQPGTGPPDTWCNHVISDRVEMGSVFKVITLAAALELGVVSLDQRVFCENGRWTYNKATLHDDGHSYGYLTVRECLAKSSNIGLAKIGLMVGPDRFYHFITRFGFNQRTGIPLPCETAGFVRHPTNWSGLSLSRLAIGHELAVTQIELAMAYAVIANDGQRMRPLLVSRVDHPDGTLWAQYPPAAVGQVVRPETARQLREAMMEVVESGTGKAAALPEHTVAGKTGTAQKSDGHRYVAGRLYCSFVGMVPARDPELVIAVALDEPQGRAYGGTVAAPVFKEIAQQAVVLYNIAPDKQPPSRTRQIASRQDPTPRRSLFAMLD